MISWKRCVPPPICEVVTDPKGGDADAVETELSGLFLLHPKKRSMRTRIKATWPPLTMKTLATSTLTTTKAKASKPSQPRARSKQKQVPSERAKLTLVVPPLTSRRTRTRTRRDMLRQRLRSRAQKGWRCRGSKLASLVCSPRPNTDVFQSQPFDNPGDAHQPRRRSTMRSACRTFELSKKKRAVKRGLDRNGKATEPRAKESASKRSQERRGAYSSQCHS